MSDDILQTYRLQEKTQVTVYELSWQKVKTETAFYSVFSKNPSAMIAYMRNTDALKCRHVFP